MGSDYGAKKVPSPSMRLRNPYAQTASGTPPRKSAALQLLHIHKRRALLILKRSIAFCAFPGLALYMIIGLVGLPAPEVVSTETFPAHEIIDAVDSNNLRVLRRHHFPPRCVPRLREITHLNDRCSPLVAEHEIVFACHRKWCQSWFGGFCEAVGGLGDRTRFLLSQVEDVLALATATGTNCKARIGLDYTVKGLALHDSLVYQDPAGWEAELWHYRSYDISDRLPLQLVLDGAYVRKNPTNETALEQLKQNHRHDNTDNPMISLFSHFIPIPPEDRKVDYQGQEYELRDFDPCTFHSLFQPGASLQRELNRHNLQIEGTSQEQSASTTPTPSLGIHFRTGDASAFGLTNEDQRVASLETGWSQMINCAKKLATRMFPKTPWEEVSLFLATDNMALKKQQQQQKDARPRVYTTKVAPSSYLRGLEGDRDAWLELYLLAARQGMVVNVRPDQNYTGHAARLSQFSVLAKKIGFMDDHHVMECELG